MLLLGVVLLALAVALATGIVSSNTAPVDAEAFGTSLSGVSVGELFLIGAATGAAALLGLVLLLGGLARSRRRRRDRKQEVRAVRDERETLAEQNQRLEAELADTREREQRLREQTTRDASAYPSDPTVTTGSSGVREDVDLADAGSRSGRGRHRLR